MKVRDFEERIWNLERLRIVVRASRNEEVEDYNYKNSANENLRLGEFLKNRVVDRVDGRDVSVIQGNGQIAHGNTLLYALRESYSAE